MDTFLSQVMMFVCVTVPLSYAKDSVCTGKKLDNANMLFIVDIFEFSLFLVTIIFGALLLYRAVMWKFNADSKEDDQFKSRPMVMVQGTLDDANQPLGPIPISQPVDTSPQEAPIMEKTKFTLKNETAEEEGIGETPELVYNPCYGPVSEKDKHETLEQKHPGQTKLGETPELADNICYEALSENAGHSSYHDLEAEDDTGHDEAPELVYNICYGTVTSKGGQATPVDQEDIEQGETPEFVENVCYEAFSEA